jgi:ribosomal-protein-alanine N-acetyltransferase
MIKGELVSLRPVREEDLEEVHRKTRELEARGPWCPLPRISLTKFVQAFHENGLWSEEQGIFAIVMRDGKIVGNVDWERLNGSVPDVEAAYRIYNRDDWGEGLASAALHLLTGWLFDSLPANGLRLVIHVDNAASRRVAETYGYAREATSPAAWQHKGRWHDVDVYILNRSRHERLRVEEPDRFSDTGGRVDRKASA